MIKILLTTLLTLSIAIPAHSSSAKVYVWRNSEGVLVYSDTPNLGAKEVKISQGNIIKSPTTIDTKIIDITTQKTVQEYKIIINQPKNNSTIRDNTGSVYISSNIKPAFKRNLKIQLMIDNKAHLTPQTNTIFSLHNIDRGEHQIKMRLLDEKGKVIALSKAITFYMHRASLN